MSVILEESIRAWMAGSQTLRERITEQGTERFLAVLGSTEPPDRARVDRASASARDEVFAALTADAVLDSLPTAPTDAGAREALRSRWLSLSPAWSLPLPVSGPSLSAQRLAIAAAIGSLLGMMLLGGLLNLTLGIRGVGMLIGGPAGAALAMYAVGRLTESKALRRTLKTLLGVAWTADLLGAASLGLGALWGRLAGVGLLRRILVYAGAVSLLAFTRGGAQYDIRAYRRSVRDLIRQWVEVSSVLLGCLSAGPVTSHAEAALDAGLARAIQDLHRSEAASLPAAAEALLLEARRMGLEGISAPPRFAESGRAERPRLRWSPELEERYRPFGLIEDGDTVIVEDEPVIQNGRILEKGHVRKQR
ncbi:hypothetical protein [Thiocystis violacea]|uniref:hypothetical protein n=1 Tax=Thiocystis violacea TaxID=13725 RepID=UPI0019044136|nr:hypothetical protein [Thiocystis violacea]MBK1717008.1 hypothetical protein [Thiocystis violacea]